MTLREFILARFAPFSTSRVEFVDDPQKSGELLALFHARGLDARMFNFQFFRAFGFVPGGRDVSTFQCSIQFGNRALTSDVNLWKDGFVIGNELQALAAGQAGDPMVAPE